MAYDVFCFPANVEVVCLEEALHESNEAARKKVADLELALESVKAEHAAVLEAQQELGASKARADELVQDQDRARGLVADLESTLEGMHAENERLKQVNLLLKHGMLTWWGLLIKRALTRGLCFLRHWGRQLLLLPPMA
jgi:hypothetical protein